MKNRINNIPWIKQLYEEQRILKSVQTIPPLQPCLPCKATTYKDLKIYSVCSPTYRKGILFLEEKKSVSSSPCWSTYTRWSDLKKIYVPFPRYIVYSHYLYRKENMLKKTPFTWQGRPHLAYYNICFSFIYIHSILYLPNSSLCTTVLTLLTPCLTVRRKDKGNIHWLHSHII